MQFLLNDGVINKFSIYENSSILMEMNIEKPRDFGFE